MGTFENLNVTASIVLNSDPSLNIEYFSYTSTAEIYLNGVLQKQYGSFNPPDGVIVNSNIFMLENTEPVYNCVSPNYFYSLAQIWQLTPTTFVLNNTKVTNCVNFNFGPLGQGTVWFINDYLITDSDSNINQMYAMVVQVQNNSLYITSGKDFYSDDTGVNGMEAQVCSPLFKIQAGTGITYCSGATIFNSTTDPGPVIDFGLGSFGASTYLFKQTLSNSIVSENPLEIENAWSISSEYTSPPGENILFLDTTTTVTRLEVPNSYIENTFAIPNQQLTGASNNWAPCYSVVQALSGVGYAAYLLSTYYIPNTSNTININNDATEIFISSYCLYQAFLNSIGGVTIS